MRKLVLFIMFFLGICPMLHKGTVHLFHFSRAHAATFSDENDDDDDDNNDDDDDDDDDDPCDPGSSIYNAYVCTLVDQCNEASPNYDASSCELATCDPNSVNYDVDECDAQVCDPTSINADDSECEVETCDPDNVNYDVDECDAQVCDPTSTNADDTECEVETCDPDNVNYDVDECDAQVCDDSSTNYNDAECDAETCDPDNVNYEALTCFVWQTCATLTKMEAAFTSASGANMTAFQGDLAKYAAQFGLTNNAQLQQLMAQVSVETGGTFADVPENEYFKTTDNLINAWPNYFSPTTPNLTGYIKNSQAVENVVYGQRMGNGSIPGGGSKYAGRGYIQLTGHDNYQSFQQFLWDNPGLGYSSVDIMDNPNLLLTNSDLNVLATLWFFQTNVLSKITITSSTTADQVSTIVNGGSNGKAARRSALTNAQTNINCNN